MPLNERNDTWTDDECGKIMVAVTTWGAEDGVWKMISGIILLEMVRAGILERPPGEPACVYTDKDNNIWRTDGAVIDKSRLVVAKLLEAPGAAPAINRFEKNKIKLTKKLLAVGFTMTTSFPGANQHQEMWGIVLRKVGVNPVLPHTKIYSRYAALRNIKGGKSFFPQGSKTGTGWEVVMPQ
jgi:hypothetical protein